MELRNCITLIEAFLHGSRTKIEPGTILRPRQDYLVDWGNSFVYQILEKYRPAQCLPHEKSVFMVQDTVDDIYHSGGPREGYLCVVKPIGKVERHNIVYLDELYELEGDDDQDERETRRLALSYWSGRSHPEKPDVFEFVAPEAKVVSVSPYEL